MSLDKTTVARIAKLARIEVGAEDQAHFAEELSHILGWIEQLGEVDTESVAPMRSVMDIRHDWRADEVTDGKRQADILRNAPQSHDGYFVVPKVVE